MIRQIVFWLSFFSLINSAFAIPVGPLPDATFDRNIRTVMLHQVDKPFSYPYLILGSENTLQLSFDLLEKTYKNYSYSVIFCDADWMPSRISYTEYQSGFFQNALNDFRNSMSTNISYQHYELRLPNENVSFKLSGNYVVIIYEDGNDNEPVLMKRFTIVDSRVAIDAKVHRATLPAYQDQYQEVDFTINHSDYPIDNPFQTLRTVIVKNNQWRNSISDLKPLFIRNNQLIYDYEDKNLFPGGNEYRSFDTKSLKYQQANVRSIDYVNNRFEVLLQTDKKRDRMPYLSQDELNGKFLVQNQQGTDPAIDAEYVWMKFSLSSFEEIPDGNVYVVGGFTDNNCYDDYKMKYNAANEMYELSVPVKQGYFNYCYVFQDTKGNMDEQLIEGSFYETENDYVIYVYYRPFGQRYDSLIGISVLNSINRQ